MEIKAYFREKMGIIPRLQRILHQIWLPPPWLIGWNLLKLNRFQCILDDFYFRWPLSNRRASLKWLTTIFTPSRIRFI